MEWNATGALALASALFVGGHFGLSSTPLRRLLVGALGELPYLGLFSLASGAPLVWMVLAYGQAPREALWVAAAPLRAVPLVAMPFALFLVVAGYATKSPTALMQGGLLKTGLEARGILRITRHPALMGILLWALAHMVANGDAASQIFFGGFAVVAGAGPVLIDRKRRDALGTAWDGYAAQTSVLPFGAILAGRNRFHPREIRWWTVALSVALYFGLLAAHAQIFGSPAY